MFFYLIYFSFRDGLRGNGQVSRRPDPLSLFLIRCFGSWIPDPLSWILNPWSIVADPESLIRCRGPWSNNFWVCSDLERKNLSGPVFDNFPHIEKYCSINYVPYFTGIFYLQSHAYLIRASNSLAVPKICMVLYTLKFFTFSVFFV
jgi:hypothetical protein